MKILVYTFLFFTFSLLINAQNLPWARSSVSGFGSNVAYSTTTDTAGNVLITGACRSQTFAFNGSTVAVYNPSSDYSAFIAKFDGNGNLLWMRNSSSGGFFGYNHSLSISCDVTGNSYITGFFQSSSIVFGTYTLTNTGTGCNVFLVKYDPNGNVIWAKSTSGNYAYDYGNSVSSYNGGVYLTGSFESTVFTIGTYTFTGYGVYKDEGYLAKYDQNGNIVWVKSFGGTIRDEGFGVSSDANNNAYVTGTFASQTISFGSITLTNPLFGPPGASCVFLAKYDPNGNVLWAKNMGGLGVDFGRSVSTDPSGDIYITGGFGSPTITFGTTTFTNSVSENLFLTKFDPNGNVLWAKQGKTYIGMGHCVSSYTGGVFISGVFKDTITLGTSTVVAPSGSYDPMLIAKYDVNGNLVCAKALSSGGAYFPNQPISLNGIRADRFGNSYVTGYFMQDPLIIGNDTLRFFGGANVFVAKMPGLNLSASSTSLCSGETATLNAGSAISYTWLPGNLTTPSIVVSPNTNQTYTLEGTEAGGCITKVQVDISVTPTPTLNATPFFYLCSGASTLNVTGANSYTWMPGNFNGSAIFPNPTITTNYTVVGANGTCTNSAISTVSVGSSPPLTLSVNSSSGCKGACFTFSNSSSDFNPFTYDWGDGSVTSQLISTHCYSTSGVYTVTAQATYSSGCSVVSSGILTVTVFPPPIPGINILNGTPQYTNSPVLFNNISIGGNSFLWDFGDSSSVLVNFSAGVAHTYTAMGNYCIKLVATDTISGCRDSTSQCIDILCISQINFPNVFTPNQDDVNEVFTFKNDCISSFSCTIYDRWGLKIYEWRGIKGGWDGHTFSGEAVSSGIYFYVFEYKNEKGDLVKNKGFVSLFK